LGVLVFIIFCGVLIGTLPLFGQGQEDVTAQVKRHEEEINDLKKQLEKVENIDKLNLLAKHASALTEQAKVANELIDTDRKHLVNQSKSDISFWMFSIIGPFLVVVGLLITLGVPKWLRGAMERALEKHIDGFREAVSQVEGHVEEIKVIKKDLHRSVLLNILDLKEKIGLVEPEDALEFFESDKEPEFVRGVSFEFLMVCDGYWSDIPFLVRALGDRSEGIASQARDRLEQIGSDVVPSLLKVLKDPEDSRAESIFGILHDVGELSEDIVSALVEVCSNDTQQERVRNRAVDVLGSICRGRRTEEPVKTAVSALIKLLKDAPVRIRGSAALSLGGINHQMSYPALVEALGDLENNHLPREVLKNIGAPAIPALKEGLTNENENVRERCFQVLERIGIDNAEAKEVIRMYKESETSA